MRIAGEDLPLSIVFGEAIGGGMKHLPQYTNLLVRIHAGVEPFENDLELAKELAEELEEWITTQEE